MKLVKMSLAAAMLMGVNAFALENVKISGNANLFYSTTDVSGLTSNAIVGEEDGTLFDKDSSAADANLNLAVSADLLKHDLVSVSAGAGYTAVSTLGLENNFVSNVWAGSHKAVATTGATYGEALGGAKVENASWFTEAWVAATSGKSTLKLGRMELDTPLAFSETWTAEKNTFEGAVVLNQDIPATTIVLAFIGNGNGTEAFGQGLHSNVQELGLAVGPVVNAEGKFATYGTDGAYAAAVVNNSFEPLTVQTWYYDVSRLAQAFWVQADLSMEGIMAGAQFTSVTLDADDADSDTAFAVMAGYEMKDLLKAKVAYSSTNEDGSLGAAGFNTATASGASKLYTEAWWNYGYVIRTETSAINVTVEGSVADVVDLAAYYTATMSDIDANEMNEITVVASKTFGPLDASLAYIMIDAEDQNDADAYSIVQAYLTYNF